MWCYQGLKVNSNCFASFRVIIMAAAFSALCKQFCCVSSAATTHKLPLAWTLTALALHKRICQKEAQNIIAMCVSCCVPDNFTNNFSPSPCLIFAHFLFGYCSRFWLTCFWIAQGSERFSFAFSTQDVIMKIAKP